MNEPLNTFSSSGQQAASEPAGPSRVEPLDILDHPLLLMPPARVVMPLAWAGHIPFAMLLVELTRPRTIVELGAHTGNSYNAFCQAVDFLGLDSRCYAVDTWEGDLQAGLYGPEIYEELRAYQASRYQRFSTLLKMTFDEAADRFEPGSIDLLHIDGLHTYEAVRHDFETWLPKMGPRGVMLFHDINVYHGDFGVWRLWQELKARYPDLEYPHSHGLGIIAVGPDIPEPLRRLMDLDKPRSRRFAALLEQLGGYVTNERQVQGLEEKVQALEERIQAIEDMNRTLQTEVAFFDPELAKTRRERDLAGQHLQNMLGDVRLLTATLEEIRRSRSWRVLAPVRWYGLQRQRVGRLWRALRRAVARGAE